MITDAMVEKAADAIGEVWDCDEDDDDRLRVYARAALKAVIPDVVEECAKVAETVHPAKPNWTGREPRPRKIEALYSIEIARAIRSLFKKDAE